MNEKQKKIKRTTERTINEPMNEQTNLQIIERGRTNEQMNL